MHCENQEEIVARTMGFMYRLDIEKNRTKLRQKRAKKHDEQDATSGTYSVFIF
jgi:hypothetical protein